MQDRFKFRVVYYNDVGKKYFIFEPDLISADGTARAYAYGESGADEYYDTVTLNQCTGLKDKNGKLIYEGDILGGTFENLYVHYCDSCKQFQLKANNYGCMACEGDIHWYEVVEAEEQNELEVIGNIYQDKELLNGE